MDIVLKYPEDIQRMILERFISEEVEADGRQDSRL